MFLNLELDLAEDGVLKGFVGSRFINLRYNY